MSTPARINAGNPAGGQFTATARAEADVDLDASPAAEAPPRRRPEDASLQQPFLIAAKDLKVDDDVVLDVGDPARQDRLRIIKVEAPDRDGDIGFDVQDPDGRVTRRHLRARTPVRLVERPMSGELARRDVEAALDKRIAAERELERVAGRAVAATVREDMPTSKTIALGWDDEAQHPCFAFTVNDADGTDLYAYDDDEFNLLADEVNESARYMRRRVNPNVLNGRDAILVDLDELMTVEAAGHRPTHRTDLPRRAPR